MINLTKNFMYIYIYNYTCEYFLEQLILFTAQKLSNIPHAEAKLVVTLVSTNHELPSSAKHKYKLLHKTSMDFWTQEWDKKVS